MTMALVAVGGVVVGRVLLPSFSGCCCSCLVLKRKMVGYSSCLLKSEHYDRKATKYWNDFYKRHHNKFFKDRHYLEKEWGQYFSTPTPTNTTMDSTDVQSSKVVLEVGCGAGNTLFPLLDAFPNLFIHACDFSPNAISLVKSNEDFREDQVNAFVCDLTRDDLCQRITPSSVDVVTLIFTLSAVSPEKMPLVLQNLKSVVKPSGYVLFRDYAIGDFSQEKLTDKNQMLSENFCVRGDGTCAFYFSEDFLSSLFRKEGFNTTEINVYCKEIVNRSRNITMHRRWMRGVFCYQDPSDTRHNFVPKPRSDLVVVD